MAEQVFPTKGNLIKSRRQLKQAQLGFELMDRKRNILVREMVALTDEAKELRTKIDSTYSEAYKALEYANISLGVVRELSRTIPLDNTLELSVRSVMGVELPKLRAETDLSNRHIYALGATDSAFDMAFVCFNDAKAITVRLAEIENSIYRLAVAIKKTQKRANALKNIMIPRFQEQVRFISNALEEKEREEFSRQKIIKRRKTNG